jgi:hypothetical protein
MDNSIIEDNDNISESREIVIIANKSVNYRKKIIYFHICCINNWYNIVNNILSEIKTSGLYDKIDEIRCCILGDYVEQKHIFEDEKINIVYHSYDLQLYEFKLMEILYKDSMIEDFDVLYIHSKGVKHNGLSKPVTSWVQYLIYFNITLHEKCLYYLEKHSTVGVNLSNCNNIHYSGNFWWSKSEHIKTLEALTDKRYQGPEFYVTTKKYDASYLSLWNSNIDHYYDEYPTDIYTDKSEMEYTNSIYIKTL